MVSAKTVDFTSVKDGGGRFNRNRLPAGDYLAKIIKVEDAESKKDGAFQYLFSLQIVSHPSRIFPYYCKLQENQLWKLRNLLVASGMSVPKKRLKLDPSKVLNKLIGVTVEDTEYDGKEQSEIAGVFPAAELADGNLQTSDVEEDEDDIDGEAADAPLEDDDDEDVEEEDEAEADPYADLDRAQLKAELKSRDSEFVAKKSQSDDDLRDLLRASDVNATGSDEEDEEEEEEPEPAPAKKAAPARRKKAAPKAEEISDDDLDEIDIDDI